MVQEDQNNWLSISEASNLASKSKMTIWRIIQRVLSDVKDNVKGDVKDIVKVESFEGGGLKKYYIRTNFIKKWFKLSLIDVKGVKQDVKHDVKQDVKGLERELWATKFVKVALEEKVEDLRIKGVEDTRAKDKLVDFLKEELKTKNTQIMNYNERSRETNLLMLQLQNKVKLLEEPKKKWWRK